MTQNDPPLQNKTPIASPHNRYVRSIVSCPVTDSIAPDLISSLRPHFVKKPKTYKATLSGFPLLRKEPFHQENSLNLIKKRSKQTTTNLPILYAALPPLQQQSTPDQTFNIFRVIGALIAHGLLILAIIIAYFKFPPHLTNGNNEQGQPVDVVFMPSQTGSSGLTEEGLSGEDGQTPPPPPPAALPEFSSPPAAEENVSIPEPQTEQLPDTGSVALPIPKQQTKTPKKQPTKNHQYTYHYTPQRQQRRQQTAPKSSNNPFETMQNLDFSENPNKSRRKAATHKLPQGSRSHIDMSTGPLVKNGKINVPYAANINIKGVSDGYGAAINAWIRKHLYYPIEAAKKGEDGSASVHVSLNRDGYVLSVSLTNSSGSEPLDAAITGMFRGARLPKIPPDLPDHFELDLTINYILLRQ